jgi:hypothetical protein
MPLVALLLTWASFDWTMSLERQAASTIFGLYFFAGAFVGAIALVTLIMLLARDASGIEAGVTIEHAHAIGRLLFAMVCFWAYMAFSQLLLVWIANIPREAEYYVRRSTGSWAVVSALLVVGMFTAPFFALLSRSPKRRVGALASVAVWVFLMHYVDVYWMVMPARDVDGARPSWLDVAAALFIGGLTCAWITRSYFARPALPPNAPDLAEGLQYEAAP